MTKNQTETSQLRQVDLREAADVMEFLLMLNQEEKREFQLILHGARLAKILEKTSQEQPEEKGA